MLYSYLKALHLISVISWFAGLFYIFRLFVYHTKFKLKPDCRTAYELMEAKLMKIIMKPAMVMTFVFGAGMLYLNADILKTKWFFIKMTAVVLLIAYQVFAEITRRHFADGHFFLSEKACRWLNEVPTLALIIAVFMAILKPV